jgi:hypothetical protein
MRGRVFVLTAVAVGLTYAYSYALLWATGFAAARPIPAWWWEVFHGRLVGVLVFMISWHTLAVVAAAIPFAWIVARLYGAKGWLVALAIGLVTTLPLLLPFTIQNLRGMPARQLGISISDYAVLIGTLPCLAWLLRARPLTARSSGP